MNRTQRRQSQKTTRQQGGQALPPDSHRQFLEAVRHHQAKHFSEAERLYSHILDQFPTHPDTLHLRGLLAYQQGHYPLASQLIEQAIHHDSQKAPYHYNLGLVREKEEHWEEAITSYRKALALNPQSVEALTNLGNVYRRQRQWLDAIKTFQEALKFQPHSGDLHNHLGVTYKEKGEPEQALSHYRQALTLTPHHVQALNNMGVVLGDQGKLEAAAQAFQQAVTLQPGYVNAHYHLGLIRLWQQQDDAALACFTQSRDLAYNHGRGMAPAFVTKARIKHDFEQWHYLRSQNITLTPSPSYAETLETLYAQRDRESPESLFMELTPEQQQSLAPAFNRLLYLRPTPKQRGPVVNPSLDVDATEQRYFSTEPEAMYVDDLLTETAISELRAFCLESTIWKRDYQNGYIGTFLANGFACPLLIQIAHELRTRFPKIFQHHQLQQAWAFKHDSALRGLNMHADAAAVNVNFWITPNEGNRNPQSGGLVVWDKEAPDDWDFVEYNDEKNQHKIHRFLEKSGAKPINVPHRHNRAIIFNSNLFHETDIIEFQDTYEHRRINVTLLYGLRQKTKKKS